MRCGPETGGGDSGVSALTSEPRYVGGGRVLEGGFVGVEIKKVSAEGDRDGLRWAISSPGAILKGQRIPRAGFLVGL
jgi:hypothetical protein